MNEQKNYYEVLEVPYNARSEEIYQNYQRTKAAYSNDSLALYSLMSVEECKNVLELVEEAYSILSDPAKRKRYDEARGINSEFSINNYNFLSNRVDPIRNETAANYRIENSHLFQNESHSSRSGMDSHSTHSSPYAGSNSSSPSSSNVSKLVTQKRFSLDYVQSTDFEQEIESATEFSGEFLRKIREYKNVDLERLADMTKVSKSHLQNIELEDFTKLPAAVYVRGFVFQYAKCLKLKPDIVANSYLNRMKKLKT